MEDIRNEVDRLIEHLRAEPIRSYRLSKLAAEANLSVSQARKWIHILEARGQVRVRYSLTDDEVMWVAKTVPHAMGRGSASSSETSFETPSQAYIEKTPFDAQMEAANFSEDQFRRSRGIANTLNPTSGLDAPQSSQPPKPPADLGMKDTSAAPNSQDRTDDDESAEEKRFREALAAAGRKAASSAPHETDAPALRAEQSAFTPPSMDNMKIEEAYKSEPPALPPLPHIDERAAKMSQKLKSQIEKARAKMGDIDKIKDEKRKLLVEVYRPMETKLEGEAGTITEKLITLENQILSLREEAAKVPGEFSELASEQERIAYVASEMMRAYNETNTQMTQSMTALHQARANAQVRFEEAQADLEAQRGAAEKARSSAEALGEMEAAARARLAEATEALAAQQAQLDTARSDFAQLESIRTDLVERMHSADATLEQQKSILSDIEKQLGQLDHVEEWVSKHRTEYDSRMQALAHYIENAESEHAKLKAAVDSGFVHSYLKDLRALSESYEFELSQAQQQEGDIDTRLATAKSELAALLAQAREIADLQEMHLTQTQDESKDLTETAVSRGKLFDRVKEEAGEREDIRNMIRRTVAGQMPKEKKTPKADISAFEPETGADSLQIGGMNGGGKQTPSSRPRGRPPKNGKSSGKRGRK